VRVLLTGAQGQVGCALTRSAPAGTQLLALSRLELDIVDEDSIARVLEQFRPDVVINTAAYTAVDSAEAQPDLAASANVDGPALLATAIARTPGRMVHLSTDFVFDGAESRPYAPDASPNPRNVYGKTKLAGERAVLDALPERSTVLRTSWVYGATGRNFLLTMLRLMREKGVVRVVDDQVGSPTSTASLTRAIWRVASDAQLRGIHHWTDAGIASWYDFAMAIATRGFALGLLSSAPEVIPISTADFPYAAARPAFSVLDKRATAKALGIQPVHWQRALADIMTELAGSA